MVMQIRFENKIFLLVKEIFEMLPTQSKTNWWNEYRLNTNRHQWNITSGSVKSLTFYSLLFLKHKSQNIVGLTVDYDSFILVHSCSNLRLQVTLYCSTIV